MASGLSPKLPLTVSDVFGPYNLNTTFDELAKQNLKMLVLTNPGERIMNPRFGVGIRKFLFEFNGAETYNRISSAIQQQTSIDLPYIRIDNINYTVPENNPELFPHDLSVSITFTIIPLQQRATVEIQLDN
jgi:hypothetical protein